MSTSPAAQSTSNPAGQTSLCRLLTWRDPVRTGTTFGAIIAVLTVVKLVNLITLFLRATYWLLLRM